MKKILLSLGTIAAIAVPVTSVIACGSATTDTDANTTFKDASTEQAAALNGLGTTIASQTSLDLDGTGTIAKTEIKEDEVRFTINPPSTADFTSVTRITVSFFTNKITMLEREVNGDFHDNTSSIKDLEEVSLSIKADIIEAKEALDKVDAGSDSKPITDPGAATLEGFKKMNIATINNSKLSDEEKTAAIAKVNGAKTIADLTEVMKEISKKITDAANEGGTDTGSSTNFEATTLAEANKLLEQFGVQLDDAQFNELKPIFAAGNKLAASHAGVMSDATHSSDDFALLINGADSNDGSAFKLVTDSHQTVFDGKTLTNSYYTLSDDKHTTAAVSDYYDEAEDSMQEIITGKWGKDFADAVHNSDKANYLVWIQVNGDVVTIEAQKVYTTGSSRLISDAPVDTGDFIHGSGTVI